MTTTYPIPDGLGAAGQELWTAITNDVPAEVVLDARDLACLASACRQADRAAELTAEVERDGAIIAGKQGPRLHPAVAEARLAETAVSRLLGQVDLDASSGSQAGKSRAARSAAHKRWANAGQSRRADRKTA